MRIATSSYRLLAVSMLFVALTLIYTYPVWTAPARLLNDAGDAPLNAWIMAWDARALADAPSRLFDANIFHPRARALALSENLLGSAVTVLPINWLGEPILAYNVVLLAGLALSGFGAFLWVRQLTGSMFGGIVAGVIWAFAPPKLDHLPQIQLLTGQWIVLALWMLTRYVDRGRRRDLLAAAALVGWQYLSGIHLTLLLLPSVALYLAVLLRLREGSPWYRQRRRVITDLALAAMLGAILVVPVSLPYLELGEEGFQRTLEGTTTYAARPRSLLAPTSVNRAPHMLALAKRYRITEANLFPGAVAFALLAGAIGAAAASRNRRHPAHSAPARTLHRATLTVAAVTGSLVAACAIMSPWLGESSLVDGLFRITALLAPAVVLAVACPVALLTLPRGDAAGDTRPLAAVCGVLALLCFLLALGPSVRAFDGYLGPGPHRLLFDWVLPFRSIRAVGRFGLGTLLWIAAGAGVGAAGLAAWLARRGYSESWQRGLALATVTLVAAEYWTAPLPVHDFSAFREPVYAALAGPPRDGAVVHVPLTPGPVEADATIYMLGATRHWRPLVNGYSGFRPLEIRMLESLEPFENDFYTYLRQEITAATMVVQRRYLGQGGFAGLASRLRADRRNVERVRVLDDALIVELRTDVDRGGLVRRHYSRAQIAAATQVRFEARALAGNALIEVSWSDGVVARAQVGSAWTAHAVALPERETAEPDGSYRLTWAGAGAGASRALGATEARLTKDVLVNVQPGFVGLALADRWRTVWSQPVALLIELDAEGRGILRTSDYPSSANGLRRAAARLASLPSGRIVAVLIDRGAEGGRLPDELVAALGRCGLRADAASVPRYAALGVVDAPPGSAIEHADVGRAWVRAGPRAEDRPQFALRRIRLEPQG